MYFIRPSFAFFLASVYIRSTMQCSSEYNKTLMYQFSIKMLSIVAKNNDNFVIAPTSAWANLMLLTSGATGETLKELHKLKTLKTGKCRNQRFKKLIDHIKTEAYNLQSMRCAAFVVDRNMSVEYMAKVRFDYGALLIDASIDSGIVQSLQVTNSLVFMATRGEVKNAIAFDFINRASLRVFDVNLFKAVLKVPVSLNEKSYVDFHKENGDKIGQVRVLNKTGTFKLISLDMGCLVFDIPIPSSNMSMIIFLPIRGISVKTIIGKMMNIKLPSIIKKLKASNVRKISLLIPRIKIKTELSLKSYLQKMGILKMFQEEHAEFSNMGSARYYVSALHHYSEIEFKEEYVDSTESNPNIRNVLTISINRPFVFIVVETVLNVVVYSGVFSDPSNSEFD